MDRRKFMKTVGIGLISIAIPAATVGNELTTYEKYLRDQGGRQHEIEINYDPLYEQEEWTVVFPDGVKYKFMGAIDEYGTIRSSDGEFLCSITENTVKQ